VQKTAHIKVASSCRVLTRFCSCPLLLGKLVVLALPRRAFRPDTYGTCSGRLSAQLQRNHDRGKAILMQPGHAQIRTIVTRASSARLDAINGGAFTLGQHVLRLVVEDLPRQCDEADSMMTELRKAGSCCLACLLPVDWWGQLGCWC
jgi:hypothetical protein